MKTSLAVLLSVVVVWTCAETVAQQRIRPSQRGSVMQMVAAAEISIAYGRPVARGRELFGALLPYGVVWHPGADEATMMSASQDVRINGQLLVAGRYSLWTIPGQGEWTFIFSKAADVFHTPYPGEAQDVLRLIVKPETGAHMETMAFYFPAVDGNKATLRLHWGETIVPLEITAE